MRCLVLAMVSLAFALMSGSRAALPEPTVAAVGAVEAVNGEASAALGDQQRALGHDSPVFIHDNVRTGEASRVTLKLGKRTTLRMGERASIVIDRYIADAGGEIDLGSGFIQFERKGPKSDEPVTFRSEYGLIAVRGTRFYAGPTRGKFGVLVGTGRVEVTAGGKTIVLGPQQGTDIASPGAAPSDPKTWPYERIREIMKAVH